ncbi:MAG TPA: DUF1622 domain-containing protein [Halanaerobiales bacterium]|nr:DUF1622 domain-containing protein [Halanaerobiales bacterium]
MFLDILDWISIIIGILGIFVIVWGVILTFAKYLMKEFNHNDNNKSCIKNECLRHALGSYLLLGLEILIAADIIKTIKNPELKEIAILASIVAIRTVISHFLDLDKVEPE